MSSEEIVFKKASNSEIEMIRNQVSSNFGSETLVIFNQKQLWIKEGRVNEVYLVSDNLSTIVHNMSQKIVSAGIPIGSLLENTFQLEIEGSYLILPFTNKKIKVKTNQFLYGKPIFVENVVSLTDDFKRGEMLIVLGKNDLHYGIGKAEIDSSEIKETQPNTIIVKGLRNKRQDRGWYLRKGN